MLPWSDRLSDLRPLLSEKLGTRGADLHAHLRQAGRRLPRRLRRETEFLARAEQMARHPRLARLIDPREVSRAQGRVSRHLQAIDPALIRRNRMKNGAAGFGLIVLASFALVVTLLRWRGYV